MSTVWMVDPDMEQAYESTCRSCGKVHIVVTQKDNHPEYYAEVKVICHCETAVVFSLPIN